MEKKRFFQKLKMIFPRKERRYFFLLFFLILIKTLFDFLGVSLILPLVNLLINPKALHGKLWYRIFTRLVPVQNENTVMLLLVLTIIAVYILKNVFAIYMSVVQNVFLTRNQLATSARMLDCYMRKPYTFHLQHNTAEIIRGINHDAGSAYTLVGCLIKLITSILISALLIVYLVLVDPKLTLSIVAGLTFYTVAYFLIVRSRMRAAGQKARKLRMTMLKTIQQATGGIKEVKLMGRERFFVDSYRADADEYVKNYRRYTILSSVPKHLVEIFCVSGVLGLVAYKIGTHQDLSAVVGSLSAFAVASLRLLPNANTINTSVNNISYSLPGLDAVCEVIDENWGAGLEGPPDARPQRQRGSGAPADICIEDLQFTYPEMDAPVLRDVSMTIPRGSRVGIVGVTGAGKTTLVDLILGLLTPDEGRILCDGRDIREDYGKWQARIGYIPQDIYLTDESIRRNVALGIRAEEIDDAQVWKCLEAAQLGDFVRGLKEGLDTVIGERGVRISGGQQQRIGIARALYHEPDVLFLDEATSSLDTETEQAVMASVRALQGEKTCIIIAHRLSTIADCDAIFRVENGSVTRER